MPIASGPDGTGGVVDGIRVDDSGIDVEVRSPFGERALARIERTYLLARALVALGLLISHAILAGSGVASAPVVWAVITAYAVQTLALQLWRRRDLVSAAEQATLPPPSRPSLHRVLATIGVDFLTFAVLHAQQPGPNFNFAALLVLPVLMAGVLLPRRLALGMAAAVTMSLLGIAWYASLLPDGGAVLMQSGLAGIGLFVIAWIAGELAARLMREERVARGSLALARQQSQLNRLVIDEMSEGVLVVDHRLRVRAANPAARALLGLEPSQLVSAFSLSEQSAWEPLAELAARSFRADPAPSQGVGVDLRDERGLRAQVRVRVRFTESPADSSATRAHADPSTDAYCVLMLEDVREARARLQQEKLAAMGRMSAGIAHEIRNPLAAIAQANELLAEEALPPSQKRLAHIVSDNVRRLQRIVDDVLEVVPGQMDPEVVVEASAVVRTAAFDWCRTDPAREKLLRLESRWAQIPVVFDPDHLRRVIINLLDNAWTHGTRQVGGIAVVLGPASDPREVCLTVSNQGQPIDPASLAHLFEPFFSMRSRGSGLGLYICRELCGRHGARIEHHVAPGQPGAAFVITMRRPMAMDKARAPTSSLETSNIA